MEFRIWIENKQEGESSNVVSFDFDGVLHSSVHPGTIHPLSYNDSDLEPRYDMHERLKQEARNGNKIIIVSARCYDWPIHEFIKAYKLPVEDVFVTCDQSKLSTLKAQKAIRHYNDNDAMEWEIEDSGMDIEFIFVPPER